MQENLLNVIVENLTELGMAIREQRDQVRRLAVQNDNLHSVDERIVKQQLLLEKLERESDALAKLVLQCKDEVLKELASNENAIGEKVAAGLAALREKLLASDKGIIESVMMLESKIDPDRYLSKVNQMEAILDQQIQLFQRPVQKEMLQRYQLDSPLLTITGIIGYVIVIVWVFNQLFSK